MKSWLNFAPDHREDLAKSRLTLKNVLQAGVHSMRPCDISKKLKSRVFHKSCGPHREPAIRSVLVFPYLLEDGFSRFKLFWNDHYTGDRFKYYQPPGQGCPLYLTHQFLESIGKRDIYITEGEKKALKMSSSGYPACALAGVWNFGKRVMDRLSSLSVRRLIYIPDSDVWGRGDLERSIARFRNELSFINCELIIKREESWTSAA